MSAPRVQVRHALVSDLEAIVALERASIHAPHWPPAIYRTMLDTAASGSEDGQEKSAEFATPRRCVMVAGRTSSNAIPGTMLRANPGAARATPGAAASATATDVLLAGFAVGLLHREPASTDLASPSENPGAPGRAAELESVVVDASARRAGIGRALCAAVLDWLRTQGAAEVVLEVRSASVGAIALYTGLGFIEVGRRPRYYRDPEDTALTMRLKFD